MKRMASAKRASIDYESSLDEWIEGDSEYMTLKSSGLPKSSTRKRPARSEPAEVHRSLHIAAKALDEHKTMHVHRICCETRHA